jgi:hypothetical protein
VLRRNLPESHRWPVRSGFLSQNIFKVKRLRDMLSVHTNNKISPTTFVAWPISVSFPGFQGTDVVQSHSVLDLLFSVIAISPVFADKDEFVRMPISRHRGEGMLLIADNAIEGLSRCLEQVHCILL